MKITKKLLENLIKEEIDKISTGDVGGEEEPKTKIVVDSKSGWGILTMTDSMGNAGIVKFIANDVTIEKMEMYFNAARARLEVQREDNRK